MKEKITMSYLMKSIAGLILNEESNIKKEWKKLEDELEFKISEKDITELLIAKLFVGQMVLNQFLTNIGRESNNLLDTYFIEAYELIKANYKHLNTDEAICSFEELIQTRFEEYYKILADTPQGEYTKALGKNLADRLTEDIGKRIILAFTFTGILLVELTTTNECLKELSEKFEIITEPNKSISKISTYKKGEYSQINLNDGKVLLSYGASDMRVFKLNFLSLPKGTIHIFDSQFLYNLTQKISYDLSKDIVKILADELVKANSLAEIKEVCLGLEKDKEFLEKI